MTVLLRFLAVLFLTTAAVADPALGEEAPPDTPPVDCPLAKHGVHPGDLRPFKDVEKYIEFKQGKLPQGPPEKLKIPRAKLLRLATSAGLVLDAEKPKLLPYQTFVVFRKP